MNKPDRDQIQTAWGAQGALGNAPGHRRTTLFLDVEDAVVDLSGDERRRSARVEPVLMRVAEWWDDETAIEVHDGIDARRPALAKHRADDVHRSFDESGASALAIGPRRGAPFQFRQRGIDVGLLTEAQHLDVPVHADSRRETFEVVDEAIRR